MKSYFVKNMCVFTLRVDI